MSSVNDGEGTELDQVCLGVELRPGRGACQRWSEGEHEGCRAAPRKIKGAGGRGIGIPSAIWDPRVWIALASSLVRGLATKISSACDSTAPSGRLPWTIHVVIHHHVSHK